MSNEPIRLETWGDLANAILALPNQQRIQPIQICPPTVSDAEPIEMLPGIALGTVGQFEFRGVRSVHDNKYHGDDVVLLLDHGPFAEDGAIAYELMPVGRPGAGKPIYGPSGPTEQNDQWAPIGGDEDFDAAWATVCKNRLKKFPPADSAGGIHD